MDPPLNSLCTQAFTLDQMHSLLNEIIRDPAVGPKVLLSTWQRPEEELPYYSYPTKKKKRNNGN